MLKIITKYRSEIILIISIILISMISFNLGKMKALREIREPVKIYDNDGEALNTQFWVVASRNSDKYHFPWCPGADKIKDSNKIIFESEKAAQAAGYILAGNCAK